VEKKLAIELEFTEAEFNAIAASMSGLSPTDQELETWVNEALDEKLRSLGAYGDVPDDEPAPCRASYPPKVRDSIVKIADDLRVSYADGSDKAFWALLARLRDIG